MTGNEKFKKHLQLAYKAYMQLEHTERLEALDLAVLLIRNMLRDGGSRRQRLAELDNTGATKQSDAEKAHAKLVRKSNAQSPQGPIKPVKTTTSSELRKK